MVRVEQKIVIVSLSKIKRYTNNPRKNNKTVPKLVKSIKEFGFLQPLVLDKDYEIIVGDTRYLAASELGLDEVPCIIASHLTPEQVVAYRIADNKIGEMSEWDFLKLDEEFKQWSDLKEEWWDSALNEISGKKYVEEAELPELKKPLSHKDSKKQDHFEEDTFEDAPPSKLNYLILGKRRIPLSDEEYDYISSEIEDYLERTGSLYGFVSYLKRDI